MIIGLKRATDPEEMGEQKCGICELRFEVAAVHLRGNFDVGFADAVCPECIEYLGRRNPARFPTIEEYEEAKRRYPESSYSEVLKDDEPWGTVYDSNWIDCETLTTNA